MGENSAEFFGENSADFSRQMTIFNQNGRIPF